MIVRSADITNDFSAGFSGVMATLQVGHWLLFSSHILMQLEQNTWLLQQITGWRTFEVQIRTNQQVNAK